MLRISDAAAIGMHAMIFMAVRPGQLLATADMAEVLHVSEAHLSKVLQRLHHDGLVDAVRGPKGGFRLAVAPDECTMLRVFECIEGPLVDSTCLLGLPKCEASDCCFRGVLTQVNRIVREHLASTRLSAASRIFARGDECRGAGCRVSRLRSEATPRQASVEGRKGKRRAG